MPQTPRELVTRSLKFENPERIPRHLWLLPWTEKRYPDAVDEMNRRFPSDICTAEYKYLPSPRVKGDEYAVGYYTDEWGCVFKNIQEGVVGEVETPLIKDIKDWKQVQPPYEQLPKDIEAAKRVISDFYAGTDKFVIANACPRTWERYQFLRGTENAMIDMMLPDEGGADLLRVIHEFYLEELEFWAQMDVDALMFMDDWGSQNQLLIPPRVWRQMFKPLYKEYCDIAHAYGKFAFMHSDGYVTEILDDLIEVGVDAINLQLFCMDFNDLNKIAKGKITFWGEIDRQHVLTSENPQDGRDAVRKVTEYLYDPRGGVIAQFEFGPGANPQTALAVFDEWDRVGE